MNNLVYYIILLFLSIWEVWMVYYLIEEILFEKRSEEMKGKIIKWGNIIILGSLLMINRTLAFFSDCGYKGVSPVCVSSPASCHTCFPAWCWSLRFSLREKPLGASAVWLGTDGKCPFCPMMRRRYLAGIFVKVQPAASGSAGMWKGRNKDISVSGAGSVTLS